ncbi:MAG: hypothetical protein IKF01_04160 [Bacilli bacterium]|nr:hypothetical protein [Bacilli bacterium]
MQNISVTKFVNTLIEIVTTSGASILFVILGIIFTIAMIINLKKHKTIGKTLYILGWIFIIVFILVKYVSYISKIFDSLINTVFKEILFPSLSTYIIVITITNILFLITIFNKKTHIFDRIVNCAFFSAIMTLFIYTLDVITKNNINIYSTVELYSNHKLLILIETVTIVFTFWMIILLSKYLITFLIEKSNEKIKKEYSENAKLGSYLNRIDIALGKYLNK